MKKLNRILVIFMIAVFAIPMLNSCKKGEGDPAISLKSRASRLKGTWTLDSGSEMGTSGTSSWTVTYTSSMATWSFGGNTGSYPYTETVEFLKDNIFKGTIMEDGDLSTTEGFWTFMDGYDDVAGKECVVLRIKQSMSNGTVQSWTGDDMPMAIMRLNKLSSSEMIVEGNGTSMSGGNTSTSTNTKTYVKK